MKFFFVSKMSLSSLPLSSIQDEVDAYDNVDIDQNAMDVENHVHPKLLGKIIMFGSLDLWFPSG